jgi:type I restriction enzyme S subunit
LAKWKEVVLNSLCDRIGDGLHGTPEYVSDSDIKFINGNNIKSGKIQASDATKNVSEDVWAKNHIPLNSNTLLMSINGTLGSLGFYREEKVMLGKSVAYINFKSDINRFYYYYFQLDPIQNHFHNIATGSTIKNLSLASIQEFKVPFPDRDVWLPIVQVLEAIDAKVAHNESLIQLNRDFGKNVYKYWFQQFEFPSVGGNGYKSSGGVTKWNKELMIDIPESWSVQTLVENEITTFLDPGILDFDGDKRYLATADVDGYEINWNSDLITFENREGRANMQPCPNSVWFAKMKNSKKFLYYGGNSNSEVSESILSTGFAGLTTSEANLEYLINVIDSPEFEERKDFLSIGATQEAINKQAMNLIPFLVPASETLQAFHNLVRNNYIHISLLMAENRKLFELRKFLIPKLMSQVITVK